MIPELDTFELEGWNTFKTPSNYIFKVSEDGNWMLDLSPFSESYRLIPSFSFGEAYEKFMTTTDIFLKNESKNIEELLKLYNELLRDDR